MRRSSAVRLAALVTAGFGLASTGSAYYFYTYFKTTNLGSPVFARFDLNILQRNTVPFFISDRGPAAFAPGDSFQAVISEIRSAAEVWNGVSTSSIRLGYGGLFTTGATGSAPAIEIEFSNDIPPGLLAYAGPVNLADFAASSPNGQFVPILRSRIYLPSDLSNVPALYGPFSSYSEQFFVTLVHEFGHTLGLQHTLTSSVMATLTTSAASKATPLGADDIAAISLLYPTPEYPATVGSISGRVTFNGNGVNLASVVAISASNPAVSAITNPDGSYQIGGVTPGQYYVYVQPLPPRASGESSPNNIVYPYDRSGNQITAYTAFTTQFYSGLNGGTRDQFQARPVPVFAANNSPNINFSVTSRNTIPVYGVRTYGYSQTSVAETSPPLTVGMEAPMVAYGTGLLQNDSVAPGLSISVIGSAANVRNVRPYLPYYIALDVLVNFSAGPGPKHLLFTTPTDVYVLPAGFAAVNSPAPFVSSLAPTGGNVLVTGANFTADTRILFDGLPATILGPTPDGRLLVTPPQAPGGYTASIVALNSDGQSSLMLQPAPVTYTYDGAAAPSLTVAPIAIPPAVDTVVDVVGVNTNFVQGQTTIGFGNSDIVIKDVTVLSPTHLTAVVTPGTFASTAGISVTTGLRVISQALGNQIAFTNPQQ